MTPTRAELLEDYFFVKQSLRRDYVLLAGCLCLWAFDCVLAWRLPSTPLAFLACWQTACACNLLFNWKTGVLRLRHVKRNIELALEAMP